MNSRIALRRRLEAPASISLNWMHNDEIGNRQSTVSTSSLSRGKETRCHSADLAIYLSSDIESGLRVGFVLLRDLWPYSRHFSSDGAMNSLEERSHRAFALPNSRLLTAFRK